MVEELIGTYRGALDAAKADLKQEEWGWEERSLQAALVVLAGEGSEEPLRNLAGIETQGDPQLEIAKFGASALLGNENSGWVAEQIEGRPGIDASVLATVELATALIRGDAEEIKKTCFSRESVAPGFSGADAAVEALRFARFEAETASRATLRVDLADQMTGWLPADESIVVVATALVASNRNPAAARELLTNGFWHLSEGLLPHGTDIGMRLTSDVGQDVYSSKEQALFYTESTSATALSDCSFWLTRYGFSRVRGLVREILEGDIVIKDLRGDRTTKKKLLKSLSDEDFTLGIRIPEAEKVLTPGAIMAIDQRFAAMESWMHAAYGDKVRCRFRFCRD